MKKLFLLVPLLLACDMPQQFAPEEATQVDMDAAARKARAPAVLEHSPVPWAPSALTVGVDVQFNAPFGVRTQIENSGDVTSPSIGYRLQWRKDGSAWTNVLKFGNDLVRMWDDPNVTDLEPSSNDMSGSSYNRFIAGVIRDLNGWIPNQALPKKSHTEHEWYVRLPPQGAGVVELRAIYSDSGATPIANWTPSDVVTIVVP